MGVYNPKGIMPKSCGECSHPLWTEYICDITGGGCTKDERPPHCPLIDIVTCGECKWYNPWHANHTNLDGNHCRYIDRPMKPTDFCSYGERRADEHTN